MLDPATAFEKARMANGMGDVTIGVRETVAYDRLGTAPGVGSHPDGRWPCRNPVTKLPRPQIGEVPHAPELPSDPAGSLGIAILSQQESCIWTAARLESRVYPWWDGI